MVYFLMFNNPSTATTPEQFITEVEESRRDDVQKLFDFVNKLVPEDMQPIIANGMISWGKFHYKSKSGREGDWYLLMLTNRKTGISFYVCATDGNEYLAEQKKKELGKAIIGKSCIRFKKLSDLNLAALEKVIKKAVELYKAGKFMGYE